MIREIHPLLSYEIKDDKLGSTGPMSPVTSAQIMAKAIGIKVSHLARVWYEDEHMLQEKDGPMGYTSHDHLVIVNVYKNMIQFCYFVDMGYKTLPVCLYHSDEDKVDLSPVYKGYIGAILRPNAEQLLEMFKSMLEHEEYYLSYYYNEKHEEFRVKHVIKDKVDGKN